MGHPALLVPGEQTMVVEYFSRSGSMDVEVSAHATGQEKSFTLLPVGSGASCSARGQCELTVAIPEELPSDLLFSICLRAGADRQCRKGAFIRFSLVPDPLRLALLADTHLEAGEAGASAASRLQQVLHAVEEATPAIHVVALLGDVSDGGERSSLARFVEIAGRSTRPVLVLPGNHDFKSGHIDHYLELVTPELDHASRLGPYLLVALNTGPSWWDEYQRPRTGQTVGLEAAQVEWLEAQVEGDQQVEAVLLHTPPWSVMWSVFGHHRERFLDACRTGNVRLIMAGHVHRNEVYDYSGLAQGLSTRCESNLPERRLPVTITSASTTAPRRGGYRRVELRRNGDVSYCWVDVETD
jgi:3',5'-cyclic AMP phosphodiesterase CpdA